MTTVCLIGNSHVANLKLALPHVQPDFPNVSAVFFASAGESMELEVSGAKLVATEDYVRGRMAVSSGTDGDIAPIYDAYVVCGLTLSSMRAIRTFRASLDAWRAAGRAAEMIADDVAKGMDAPIRKSIAMDVVAKLRRLTDAPVYLIATPLTAYERHSSFWDTMQSRQKIGLLSDAYNLACNRAAQAHGAVFVPQPTDTIGPNALTTRPEFYMLTPDQVRAERASHAHMNVAFGAIVLRDVLMRIVERLDRRKA